MDSQEILDALEGKSLEEQKTILEQLQLPVTRPTTEVEPPEINMPAARVLEGDLDVSFEVDGIQVCLQRSVLDNWELAEQLAILEDPNANQFAASVKVTQLVFGDDWPRIKNELAARHGGKLSISAVGDFLGTCFQMLGDEAKN